MTVRRVVMLFAVLALALAACGGSDDGGDDSAATTAPPSGMVGDVVNGAVVYTGTCQTCHGGNLEGIDGLGKPLAPSAFVVANTDEEMVAFIKVGRPTSHPDNTQGVDMPPKGGNPSLTDPDLYDVVAYLNSLN